MKPTNIIAIFEFFPPKRSWLAISGPMWRSTTSWPLNLERVLFSLQTQQLQPVHLPANRRTEPVFAKRCHSLPTRVSRSVTKPKDKSRRGYAICICRCMSLKHQQRKGTVPFVYAMMGLGLGFPTKFPQTSAGWNGAMSVGHHADPMSLRRLRRLSKQTLLTRSPSIPGILRLSLWRFK